MSNNTYDQIPANGGWETYGTLVVAVLTLLVNLHQSYQSKFFGMKCYDCCEATYDVNYKDNERNIV